MFLSTWNTRILKRLRQEVMLRLVDTYIVDIFQGNKTREVTRTNISKISSSASQGLTHKQVSESRSVLSDSLRSHGLYSPWNSPGQNTGVGSWSLLQGIFPIPGLNPDLPHYQPTTREVPHRQRGTIYKFRLMESYPRIWCSKYHSEEVYWQVIWTVICWEEGLPQWSSD